MRPTPSAEEHTQQLLRRRPADPSLHAALCPPELLQRAATLVALALGTRVLPLAGLNGVRTPPGESQRRGIGPGSDAALRVWVAAHAEPRELVLCDDAERAPLASTSGSGAELLRQLGPRAFAAVPIRVDAAAASAGATPPTASFTLYVLSSSTHVWRAEDAAALAEVAACLASEIALRSELLASTAAEEELRRGALYDARTGLPNRTLLLDRLGHAIERAKRHGEFRFAVLCVNVDHFKAVRDSLGHDAAGEVLAEVGRRLSSCVRGEDMVARWAGDEFVILLESLVHDSDGGRVAERIERRLATAIPTREGDVFISASIGIVLSSSGLHGAARLVQQAGIAMSRAKQAGRGRYEMFDQEMHARALARLRMETDLRRAVDRGEFELYYQPLVSLDTGRICEFEALLRWKHPEQGIVAPLDFIPLAEEIGLITSIGSWVLTRSCLQMAAWQERFTRDVPLSLSVNLSVKEFAQPNFVRHVADVIHASGLSPSSLKLEITESFAIEEPERTRAMLEELRALGVHIYLDDFGTGYSSLSYLHRLPLDAIKIDRTFVQCMDDGPTQLQLVRTVRELARHIGVSAVAEGVESPRQLEMLRTLGCESAQGFLFSRPVCAADVERLLEADPSW